MRHRFVVTPDAKDDLRKLLLAIAEKNPNAAEQVHRRLYRVFQTLGESPGIGHHRRELLDGRYRFWTVFSYVICYAWETNPIQIVAVVHGARDLDAFLRYRN